MTDTFTRADVTLGNWRQQPYSRWAFHNVGEMVPSAVIRAHRRDESFGNDLAGLEALKVTLETGETPTVSDLLGRSHADALVVMRRGAVAAEWYAPHYQPARPHIIFSITKSVTALVAAILVEEGAVRYEDRIGDILPDMAGSAYADATLAHVLDMQVSVDFVDDYLDVTGAFDRYRRAMLWNPEHGGAPAPTVRQFLATVAKAGHEHGTRHTYHSINTDLAGIVLEAVSGRRLADLISERLWKPLGAHGDGFITVDRAGTARAAGGLSVTARDLARLGDVLRLGGKGVVPSGQVERIYAGGDRRIWAEGDQALVFAGGSYRSCFYDDGRGALAGIGIHGQWLWIDRATETVIVRMASEPVPFTPESDATSIAMLRAIARA